MKKIPLIVRLITFFIYLSIFVAICFLNAIAANATEARVRDSVLEFAKGKLGSQVLWTQQEIDEANAAISVFSGTSPVSITMLTPTPWEINLSTTLVLVVNGRTLLEFNTYQDWLDCQTKAGLQDRVMKMRSIVNSMSDFPGTVMTNFQQRLGWLKSYYQSLP